MSSQGSFRCCGLSFTTVDAYNFHLRTIHQSIAPFPTQQLHIDRGTRSSSTTWNPAHLRNECFGSAPSPAQPRPGTNNPFAGASNPARLPSPARPRSGTNNPFAGASNPAQLPSPAQPRLGTNNPFAGASNPAQLPSPARPRPGTNNPFTRASNPFSSLSELPPTPHRVPILINRTLQQESSPLATSSLRRAPSPEISTWQLHNGPLGTENELETRYPANTFRVNQVSSQLRDRFLDSAKDFPTTKFPNATPFHSALNGGLSYVLFGQKPAYSSTKRQIMDIIQFISQVIGKDPAVLPLYLNPNIVISADFVINKEAQALNLVKSCKQKTNVAEYLGFSRVTPQNVSNIVTSLCQDSLALDAIEKDNVKKGLFIGYDETSVLGYSRPEQLFLNRAFSNAPGTARSINPVLYVKEASRPANGRTTREMYDHCVKNMDITDIQMYPIMHYGQGQQFVMENYNSAKKINEAIYKYHRIRLGIDRDARLVDSQIHYHIRLCQSHG